MNDMTSQNDHSGTLMAAPDTEVDVRETFGDTVAWWREHEASPHRAGTVRR